MSDSLDAVLRNIAKQQQLSDLKPLQTGAHAIGYSAKINEQQVALKLPKPDSWSDRTSFERCAQTLRNEIDVLNRLQAIQLPVNAARPVELLSSGEERYGELRIPWQIQAFARGRRLRDLGLPLRASNEYVGLRALHQVIVMTRALQERGLTHGDLKPDAIFWDEATGQAQIIDWGSARQGSAHEEVFKSLCTLVAYVFVNRDGTLPDEGWCHQRLRDPWRVPLSRPLRLLLYRLFSRHAQGLPQAGINTVERLEAALSEALNYWQPEADAPPAVESSPVDPISISAALNRTSVQLLRAPDDLAALERFCRQYTQARDYVRWRGFILINRSLTELEKKLDQLTSLLDVWPLMSLLPIAREIITDKKTEAISYIENLIRNAELPQAPLSEQTRKYHEELTNDLNAIREWQTLINENAAGAGADYQRLLDLSHRLSFDPCARFRREQADRQARLLPQKIKIRDKIDRLRQNPSLETQKEILRLYRSLPEPDPSEVSKLASQERLVGELEEFDAQIKALENAPTDHSGRASLLQALAEWAPQAKGNAPELYAKYEKLWSEFQREQLLKELDQALRVGDWSEAQRRVMAAQSILPDDVNRMQQWLKELRDALEACLQGQYNSPLDPATFPPLLQTLAQEIGRIQTLGARLMNARVDLSKPESVSEEAGNAQNAIVAAISVSSSIYSDLLQGAIDLLRTQAIGAFVLLYARLSAEQKQYLDQLVERIEHLEKDYAALARKGDIEPLKENLARLATVASQRDIQSLLNQLAAQEQKLSRIETLQSHIARDQLRRLETLETNIQNLIDTQGMLARRDTVPTLDDIQSLLSPVTERLQQIATRSDIEQRLTDIVTQVRELSERLQRLDGVIGQLEMFSASLKPLADLPDRLTHFHESAAKQLQSLGRAPGELASLRQTIINVQSRLEALEHVKNSLARLTSDAENTSQRLQSLENRIGDAIHEWDRLKRRLIPSVIAAVVGQALVLLALIVMAVFLIRGSDTEPGAGRAVSEPITETVTASAVTPTAVTPTVAMPTVASPTTPTLTPTPVLSLPAQPLKLNARPGEPVRLDLDRLGLSPAQIRDAELVITMAGQEFRLKPDINNENNDSLAIAIEPTWFLQVTEPFTLTELAATVALPGADESRDIAQLTVNTFELAFAGSQNRSPPAYYNAGDGWLVWPNPAEGDFSDALQPGNAGRDASNRLVVRAGDTLEILGGSGDFYRVRVKSNQADGANAVGLEGWIRKTLVHGEPPSSQP